MLRWIASLNINEQQYCEYNYVVLSYKYTYLRDLCRPLSSCIAWYCIYTFLSHFFGAQQSGTFPCSARDRERREQFSENENRHLADQLIKWIVSKEEVGLGSKA